MPLTAPWLLPARSSDSGGCSGAVHNDSHGAHDHDCDGGGCGGD